MEGEATKQAAMLKNFRADSIGRISCKIIAVEIGD